MRLVLLPLALLACGSPPSIKAVQTVPPPPTSTRIADCATLRPCTPDLGVCLRCVSPDNPTWVWNAAPGSPWTLRSQPHRLPDPTPDLDVYLGYPFTDEPDCAHLELDARGFPLRTLPRSASEGVEDIYEWTYDARGRVVEERVDDVPFCRINKYGDRGRCGVPDGTWDRVTAYRWDDLAGGGAIVRFGGGWEREYDARGRLVRMTPPGPDIRTADVRKVEHEYRGDLLLETRTNASTATFVYDTAGRVVERRTVSADGSSRGTAVWEYDAMGNQTRLRTDAGSIEYANTYRDGRLVSVRTSSRANATPPVVETAREHDARGLLVRLVTSEPGVRVMAEQRWIRDERGVPVAKSGGGPDESYRCLARLADRFLPR
jgi:YD repeat-containing protein